MAGVKLEILMERFEIKSNILLSPTYRIATKQPQRCSYTAKMRFGARENAERGILLAATTKHFGSIGTSLGRLFTFPSAALTNYFKHFLIFTKSCGKILPDRNGNRKSFLVVYYKVFKRSF